LFAKISKQKLASKNFGSVSDHCTQNSLYNVQSSLSYVTFQGNNEIWSHKTGGHLL